MNIIHIKLQCMHNFLAEKKEIKLTGKQVNRQQTQHAQVRGHKVVLALTGRGIIQNWVNSV